MQTSVCIFFYLDVMFLPYRLFYKKMVTMKLIFSSIAVVVMVFSFAQNNDQQTINRKTIEANYLQGSIKIDGKIDEDIWSTAAVAEGFTEYHPHNGKEEPEGQKSFVKVLYDDSSIYIAAKLYDFDPSKIAKQLTERDDMGNDDFFGIYLNGYNDNQQSFEFIVTAAGVQFDAKVTREDGEDYTWNGIWYSGVSLDEDGWSAEMRIPFSELRFPKKEVQEWGINFFRKIQRDDKVLAWNPIDISKGSILLYDGTLQGLKDVNPPVRLFFFPYVASYVSSYDGKTKGTFTGGMDVKYGINDAFTLDMTLIPDFGQANFDNTILNLGPFEQQYAEQRSFFTEGTELFSKGGMFYSRRVGGSPSRYPELSQHETLLDYPSKVKLFNAFKVSGRTNGGLGIGVFNGVTEKMEARIFDSESLLERKEVVEPWANYNVLVLDQRFRGNSSVTLVNTSTLRNGDFRDANATGLLWDITTKSNNYNLYGYAKGSWVKDNAETKFGTNLKMGFSKVSGKNRFDINSIWIGENWDINDLGYSPQTNIASHNASYTYRILKPTEHLNKFSLQFYLNYSHRIEPFLNSKLWFNHNFSFRTKKFNSFGGGFEFTPYGEKDIYEPRTKNKYLDVPGYFDSWIWWESDTRKKVAWNIMFDYYAYDQKGRNYIAPNHYLQYRPDDKLLFVWKFNPSWSNNEIGYIGKEESEVLMGRRQRNTYENSISGQYTFNNKMALSLALRHYFTDISYRQIYTLQQDGSLLSTSSPMDEISALDGVYNSWNFDIRYSWWFAPGSQLTLMYRNAVENYENHARPSFNSNFSSLFNEPVLHNFSLRLTYFLDYNRMKGWFKNSKTNQALQPLDGPRYKNTQMNLY